MPGAYGSKPPAAIVIPTYPDIPLNWKVDWPWPGPNPPGYVTPNAGINLTSSDSVAVGGSVSASSIWMDEALAGPIGLPDGDWTQRLSATINGSAIGLAKSDDPEFSSSIEYDYSIVGNYYGSSDDITFDISEENEGDTIILSVASVVDGVEYEDSVEITVEAAANTNYVRFSLSMPSVFGVTGTLTVTTPGGSASLSIGTSVASGTGVFASTDGRYVVIDAETLTLLNGATVSGVMSAVNGKSLSKHVDGTVAAQLYNEAGISIIGASTVTQFDLNLAGYGSGEDSKACFQFALDDLIQL